MSGSSSAAAAATAAGDDGAAPEFIDEYGFPHVLSKAQRKRIKVRAWTASNQWLARYPTLQACLQESPAALRTLAATHGVLKEYRADVWWRALGSGALAHYAGAPSYAALLATAAATAPVDVVRQVELDLPRTFPEQVDFAVALAGTGRVFDGSRSSINEAIEAGVELGTPGDATGSVHGALRRMLRAFAVLHPDVGYLQVNERGAMYGLGPCGPARCLRPRPHMHALPPPAPFTAPPQSMNFVAAFTLLVYGRGREEHAFWHFSLLVSRVLRGYYAGDMAMLRVDCEVFRAAMEERLPALCAHLARIGLSEVASLFLPRWLLCVFLNCFPADVTVVSEGGGGGGSSAASAWGWYRLWRPPIGHAPSRVDLCTRYCPPPPPPSTPYLQRVWDALTLEPRPEEEGPRVLLEVGLAVLRVLQPDLLATRGFADAAEVLRSVGSRVVDAAELVLLSRSPECSLANRPLAEWRRLHGGPLYAQMTAAEAAGVPAAAAEPAAVASLSSSSAAAAAPAPAPVPATAVPAPTAPSTSASAMDEELCEALGVAAPPAPLTGGGGGGRKRRRGSDGGVVASSAAAAAAAASSSSAASPLASPSALRSPRRLRAAASMARLPLHTPPPVDIASSLERVFSPLLTSPAAAAAASPQQALDAQRSPAALAAAAATASMAAGARGSPGVRSPLTRTRAAAASGSGAAAAAMASPPLVAAPVTAAGSRSLLAPAASAARLAHAAVTSPRGYRSSPLTSSSKAAGGALRSPPAPSLARLSSLSAAASGEPAAAAGLIAALGVGGMDLLSGDADATGSAPSASSTAAALPPAPAAAVARTAASSTPSVVAATPTAGSAKAPLAGGAASARPRGPSLSLAASYIGASLGLLPPPSGGCSSTGGAKRRDRSGSLQSSTPSAAADMHLSELSPVAAPAVAASALAAALNPAVAAASARKAQRASAKKPPRGGFGGGGAFASGGLPGSGMLPSSSSGSLSTAAAGGAGATPTGSAAAVAAGGGAGLVVGARYSLRGSVDHHSTSYADYDDSVPPGEAGGGGDLPMDWGVSSAVSASGGYAGYGGSGTVRAGATGADDSSDDDDDDDDGVGREAPTKRARTSSGATAVAAPPPPAAGGRMSMREYVTSAAVREMQPLGALAAPPQGRANSAAAVTAAPGGSGVRKPPSGAAAAGAAPAAAVQLMLLSPPRRGAGAGRR